MSVSLLAIHNGAWAGAQVLDGREVPRITPHLDDAEVLGNPHRLRANEGRSYQGSIVLGTGFVLEPAGSEALIERDPRDREVLFPYLNGEHLNSRPDQSPSRWVTNFQDRPENKARQYPDCFRIVQEEVWPERTHGGRFLPFQANLRHGRRHQWTYAEVTSIDRLRRGPGGSWNRYAPGGAWPQRAPHPTCRGPPRHCTTVHETTMTPSSVGSRVGSWRPPTSRGPALTHAFDCFRRR